MQILQTGEAARAAVQDARRHGKTVGLVPTMGALHEGHLSLVEAAREECDEVAASIFVNPTQFAPGEDLAKYPRSLDRDLELLERQGCSMVFTPSAEEIYQPGHQTSITLGAVAEPLEGVSRPSHFSGVATIVLKLFHLLPADRAYFGQKDYQQTLVVRQMVADLDVPIEVRVCPIVREPDGLAMSSRNRYLSDEQRQQALVLHASLQAVASAVAAGETSGARLRQVMADRLAQEAAVQVEYVALVEEGTMQSVPEIRGPVVALVAARVGNTRLIDNWVIGG